MQLHHAQLHLQMSSKSPPPKEGDEYHGLIKQKDNEMWAFIESDFKWFANFQMAVICHGARPDEADCSNVYVVHCMMENHNFNVCVGLSDLQSFTTFEKVLKRQQRSDSIVLLDIAREIHLHLYVVKMIEVYEDGDNQQLAVIANKPGFYNCGDTTRLYILSKESKFPASVNTTQEDINNTPIVWIGKSQENVNKHVGPNVKVPLEMYLAKTKQYHGDNFGSVLMLFGVTYLSMHCEELLPYGVKTATVHIVGDINTGKSSLGEQFRCLLPCHLQPDGEATIASDADYSFKLLQEKVTESGPPLLLDPAPEYPKKELDAIIDSLYEANAKQNHKTKNNCAAIKRNVIIVWPHEKQSLPDLCGTSRTKIVLLHNEHQKGFDDGDVDKDELHTEIVNEAKEFSGVFASFVTLHISPSDFAKRVNQKKKELQVCSICTIFIGTYNCIVIIQFFFKNVLLAFIQFKNNLKLKLKTQL